MNNLQMKTQEMNIIEKNVTKKIDNMIGTGISFPANYDPKKALQNFMMTIKMDTKLSNCEQTSIMQCATQMINLGLDVANKQCYPIPYGNKLTLSVSYFGNQTILKRIKGIKDVISMVIFEEDDIDYDIQLGQIINLKHKTTFKNRKSGIAGAYCVILLDEEIFGRSEHVEIMDIDEIKMSWGQGATKGNSPAHTKFPGEMAKKSVINRAVKNFTNTLTDSDSIDIVSSYNEVVNSEYENKLQADYEVKEVDPTQITGETSKEPTPVEVDPMADLPGAFEMQESEELL